MARRPIEDTEAPGSPTPTTALITEPGVITPTTAILDGPVTPAVIPAYVTTALDLPIVEREHYQVLSEHARGGLGRILRARDRRTGRVVAIKEMLRGNDETARRFAREALITANLQHPAIVPVYELGRWPSGEPFYAMKLVAGVSFQQVIAQCKTLDERLARLPIVESVAEALAFAHKQGVVHRDLKPANVLVGELGETVVIDWGLAKRLRVPADQSGKMIDRPETTDVPDAALADALATTDTAETIVGQVMGTPLYMPPEQARGEATDERSDVYQIGAMLYHLISGAAPYAGHKTATSRELIALVAREPPKLLAEREPGAPSDLVTIVGKAMAREPSERYADAGALMDDLRRFTTGRLVQAHHYDRRTLLARWLKRNLAPVTVAAILATVLAGVALWSVQRILAERDRFEAERDRAEQQTGHAETELAAALYEKGMVAETTQEWARAAMYYAAARRHHDSPASAWAAGLAEARAVTPVVRHSGHTAWVHAVAIAPDGERVASVDDSGQLRVWAPSDGHLIASRALSNKALYAVAFSPDGTELAVAGDDGVIARLGSDLATRSELRGHAGRIWSLAYSPDGALLASGGEDATIRLWSLATQAPARELAGHTQRVYSVAFSPDGKRLASGSDDRHIWLWDVGSGKGAQRGEHQAGGIRVVMWVTNEQMISTGWDDSIRIWTANEADPETWTEAGAVHGAALAPGGDVIVTGGDTAAIRAWDIKSHQLITSLDAPGGQTSAIAFSRDGRWLVTAGKTPPIVWDASAFRRIAAVGHRGGVSGIAFSADGKRFATGSSDHTLRLWDTRTANELRRISTGELGCDNGVVMLGDDLAAPCDDATLRRWTASGEVRVLPTASWLRYTAVSPDGATLAAGHADGRLALVDVASWKIVLRKTLHKHHIYGVQFTPDGRLVTTSLDDHVRVWRLPDLAPELDVEVHTDDGVLTAALAPDGSLLAIGTQDGSVDVWDTKAVAWRVRDVGAKKLETVWKLAFSPDSKHVYTASDDGVIRIWDTATWSAPRELDAGEGAAGGLAVSPDGALVVAGYHTGAIVIWNAASGALVKRIGGRTRERGSCADLATQAWVDDAHRTIVATACASDATAYFERLAARTHQRLDGEVDVTWDWLKRPER